MYSHSFQTQRSLGSQIFPTWRQETFLKSKSGGRIPFLRLKSPTMSGYRQRILASEKHSSALMSITRTAKMAQVKLLGWNSTATSFQIRLLKSRQPVVSILSIGLTLLSNKG